MTHAIVRRTLLVGGGAAALTALSYRKVLGANDRIRLGVIGTGARAQSLMKRLLEAGGNEQVAICDVYEPRLLQAAALLDGQAKRLGDHRAVLDMKDLDGVVIGSPQHWHMQMTLDALQAGKDVFLEKCVSHAIPEGERMVKAVAASDRVVQTGTQQRSQDVYLKGAEIVRSGKLGKITFIHAYWYQNVNARTYPAFEPAKLDWKGFTGSAPKHAPTPERYFKWRWYWDYGGGPICELLTHWIDVVHWYTGTAAPTTVTARGARHSTRFEVPDTSSTTLEYPDFTVTFTNNMSSRVGDGGIWFHGDKGTLRVDRRHVAFYPDQGEFQPGTYLPKPEIHAPSERDGTLSHVENFLSCVRSRQAPTAPMTVAHEAARASHLANMSIRSGRPVRWNASRKRPERA